MIQPMRLLAVGTSYRDAWTTVQKKPHGVVAMRFLNLKRSIYISFLIKPL